MKTIKIWSLIAIVAVMGFVTSCSDDADSVDPQAQLADEQNAAEEQAIPLTVIESGIEIEGATKNTGAPPQPTGSVDFQIDTKQQEGFQGSGFQIDFSSSSNIAGAYIQFKDVDGNAADSYFDVPATSISDNGRTEGASNGRFGESARTEEEGDKVIEVNFGDAVPAGEFCYDICLYDAANNVSQIQTICVTVESWGGNAEMVGTWVLERDEVTSTVPDTSEVEQREIICGNGQTLTADNITNEVFELTLILGENGSYEDEVKEEYQFLNFIESAEICSAVYFDLSQYQAKTTGNWAYNEEEGTMTAVAFKIEDLLEPGESVEFEDGNLYFEGLEVELVGGQLILTDTYTYTDFDGTEITETYKYYFNKQ